MNKVVTDESLGLAKESPGRFNAVIIIYYNAKYLNLARQLSSLSAAQGALWSD